MTQRKRQPSDDPPRLGGGIHPSTSGEEPRLGAEATTQHLLELIRHDPDPRMMLKAAAGLAEQGLAAVPFLIEARHDADEGVRWAVAAALGYIAAEDDQMAEVALPVVLEALEDERSSVRRSAAESLGQIAEGRPALVELVLQPLIARLADHWKPYPFLSRVRVCDAAAEALLRIATPEAVEAVKTWQSSKP